MPPFETPVSAYLCITPRWLFWKPLGQSHPICDDFHSNCTPFPVPQAFGSRLWQVCRERGTLEAVLAQFRGIIWSPQPDRARRSRKRQLGCPYVAQDKAHRYHTTSEWSEKASIPNPTFHVVISVGGSQNVSSMYAARPQMGRMCVPQVRGSTPHMECRWRLHSM
jgi:hypothetical protein